MPGTHFHIQLEDVETLNQAALVSRFDVTKMSFYTYLMVRDTYRLLDAGAALGFGCGPVLISKKPLDPQEISDCRVALPGAHTTAHLLFRLWMPEVREKRFVTYDKIADLLEQDEVDCGVIIHESRFTFAQAGYQKIIDLGDWWEKETGCAIPLGCIGIKKSLGESRAKEVNSAIAESIRRAEDDPSHTLPYVRQYAQEMDLEVLEQHIRTFVNEFSQDLGPTGHAAVARLESMAKKAGFLS